MKKTMLYSIICCIFLSIAASESSIEKIDPVSIAIVLDLSDRIKVKGQIDKDKAIIQSILNEFQARQKRQGYILSKDRLHLYIAYQPLSDQDVSEKGGEIFMSKTAFPQFEQAKKDFLKEVNNIYKQAINVDKNGADIYTTFCTNLAQDLDDVKRQNKIFIITDGYLLFEKEYLGKRPKCSYMRKLDEMRAKKDKWKTYFEKEKLGLCPCENQRPKNASVMMFEIANKYRGENPYEFYMVEYYWKNWFTQMKVPVATLSYGSKSATINNKIAAFIAGE